MKLKINDAPPIKKVHFSCDEPLNAKLEKYPLTKDFLNMYNTSAFIGTMGSGKTSLMINFLLGFSSRNIIFLFFF